MRIWLSSITEEATPTAIRKTRNGTIPVATIKITNDGSGSQSLTMRCSDAIVQTVQQSVDAAAPGKADPMMLFKKEAVEKELAELGLTVKSYTHEAKRGNHEIAIEATFPGTAQLAKSPLLGGDSNWVFVKGKESGQIELVCYPRGKAAHEDGKKRLEAIAQQDASLLQAFFGMSEQQLANLALKLVVDVPGDIVACSANWKKTGTRQLTATVGEADIRSIQDLVALLAPRFTVTFDGRGCTIPVLDQEK